jgi:L-ribulose-5-phosphate 3-epimerase
MKHLKLAVCLESLGLPLRKALSEASRMGVTGVQIDAVGDLSPMKLSDSGRREFRSLLRTYNLELTALGCPLRRSLDSAEDQQQRLEHVRQVMSLSSELGPRLTIVSAGQVPETPDTPEANRLRESLLDLSRHGDRVGATLALETGLETGAALAAYLATFDTGSLGANLDPANLLLNRLDPMAAVMDLRGWIRHVHARDGRKGSASRAGREVPVGAGDIDWLALLEALEQVEYRGWIAVEREEGDDRLADVASGVDFLRRLMG